MDDKEHDKGGGRLNTYAGTPSTASLTDVVTSGRHGMPHSCVDPGFPKPVIVFRHRQ